LPSSTRGQLYVWQPSAPGRRASMDLGIEITLLNQD
jgi:hypothetical protein